MRNNKGDPPLLSGTVPGLLDPSQKCRLLRTPTSGLFFAAFDPLAARASKFPNLKSLHIDPAKTHKRTDSTCSNDKRIVVETDPENGTCSWRFVPRAKVDFTLSGFEGNWPRIVEVCGQVVRMTQDQWDLYKLDPEYDCVVHAAPKRTTITRKASNMNSFDSDDTFVSDPPNTPNKKSTSTDDPFTTPKAKRHISPALTESESPSKRKKVRSSFASETEMAIDADTFHIHPQSPYEASVNRMKRTRAPSGRLSGGNAPDTEKSKGKAPNHRESFVFTDINRDRGMNDFSNPETPAKKARTRSPGTVRRDLEQKRIYREKRRKAHMAARLELRRDGLHRAFWEDLGVPPTLLDPGLYEDLDSPEESENSEDEVGNGFAAPNDPATEADPEAERVAMIEASRRKLAELEKDKPLWEENARKRQAREREEEQIRRQEKSMRKEEERQREQAQAARRRREERREQERQERERETRMQEKIGRMFVRPPMCLGWNVRDALKRYLETSAAFDATKFSSSANPATFSAIPWPALRSSFSVQEIEWDTVERFFGKVQGLLTPTEFKDLVEKSHRRFHPDRWRSRGLLVSVKDDMERDLLEVAGSTVAQAITPLWKKITGRSI